MKDTLRLLAQIAQTHQLPFLLIGGNAVIRYGIPRFTRDIDLLIPDTHEKAWLTQIQHRQS